MSTELPTPECKGLTFWPVPTFSDPELVFGAREDAFFSRRDLPNVPLNFTDAAGSLFFQSGDLPQLAPQVDRALAARAIRAWLSSWAPAHESKEATVGYALWLWSTPDALAEPQP